MKSTTPRRSRAAIVCTGTLALALTACGGGGFEEEAGSPQQSSGPAKLTILIGTSGDAETNAVKAAADAWAKKSGNTAEVVVASDLNQQLGQGFAGGNPPDVFYTDASRVGDFAKAGNLYAYGDEVKDAGFLDSLVQTYTYDGKLQCAPKDFSTLGLVINSDLWAKAGLTEADIPKDWPSLEATAKKLTSGNVTGLVISGEAARVGAFMKQAGGWIVNEDGTEMTANSPENVEALTFVKKMLTDGTMKYAKEVDAGWGGEALGKGTAAMTIEGNWIRGALQKDFPNVKATVAELPAGPKGKGTLLFSNCWGIAAKSKNQAAAVDLVKSLTSTEQQMEFAKAFGVMPSTTAGVEQYAKDFPQDAAFAAGGEYGQGPVNLAGYEPVNAAFNTDLEQLKSKDPKAILDTLQKNGEAVIQGK
ncbi:carbohydrate ABC transporter substrate-binding protein (CUT1 family) [Knoellia remsis]|uniref:Carbohydrate ABC transporter substrate-binding protein (CUT1 family) n=1 Tax=Knoellia remsis TaxID=407159 RepID=A0A2T0UXE2_9MICO|nr:extracellular solute-binding protein [Knoellia remsis]PRY62582.1 carbohydrate ABC transporter substrate-binding protein (CUT1 family) [Knoellia remsis]